MKGIWFRSIGKLSASFPLLLRCSGKGQALPLDLNSNKTILSSNYLSCPKTHRQVDVWPRRMAVHIWP